MKRLLTTLILVALTWSCTDVPHPTLPSETAAGPRGPYTLSGVVVEATPNGPEPLEGVVIEAWACQSNCVVFIDLFGVTDGNGYYSIPGMWAGQEIGLWITKAGYTVDGPKPSQPCEGCDRLITASADTQLDITLVRQ